MVGPAPVRGAAGARGGAHTPVRGIWSLALVGELPPLCSRCATHRCEGPPLMRALLQGGQRSISLEYQIKPPPLYHIWYSSNWNGHMLCAHCEWIQLYIVSMHWSVRGTPPLELKGQCKLCAYILCTYDLWMTCARALHTIYLSLWLVKVSQMGPVWHSTLLYYISLLPGCWNIDDHHRNPNKNKNNRDHPVG